ncbi:unnamed protein product [Pleuronectes platessa]|uniref:Uncharacterized protein n=1 Tax=Pleuronectes platessa TaxID=8262 RepID=A0A9N7UEB3_PLEPL|nr:unnamed protein product [Pleuronectes platessa]
MARRSYASAFNIVRGLGITAVDETRKPMCSLIQATPAHQPKSRDEAKGQGESKQKLWKFAASGEQRGTKSYLFNANLSKRQLNLLSFFKKKEELHDASKRVRKASTSGDKGSCSGHVDEQNRLQQETSATTASQLHRQLAKPGQEAGTAVAAGQVARQLERELATAPAVISQQDSEGEENALSGEECGTSSDRSGMGCTLTAAQFKDAKTE